MTFLTPSLTRSPNPFPYCVQCVDDGTRTVVDRDREAQAASGDEVQRRREHCLHLKLPAVVEINGS